MQIQFLLQKLLWKISPLCPEMSATLLWKKEKNNLVIPVTIFVFGNLSLCTVGVSPTENQRCNAVHTILC